MPGVQSSLIIIWKKELTIMAMERPLAILPKDNTFDIGRCYRETGSKTISETMTGWNLR